jgi:hypothetical protein
MTSMMERWQETGGSHVSNVVNKVFRFVGALSLTLVACDGAENANRSSDGNTVRQDCYYRFQHSFSPRSLLLGDHFLK